MSMRKAHAMERPPGRPESWLCGSCQTRVTNSRPVCPKCGARR
jgi:predicted amidophosphoribosyltransferase